MAGHALVGCASAEAGGGNCGQGALAAGFGKVASLTGPSYVQNPNGFAQIAAGTAYTAIAGGIGAELGGGKFANGAQTAAMGYLFNQAATLKRLFEGLTSPLFRLQQESGVPLVAPRSGHLVGATIEISTFVVDYSLTADTDGRIYGGGGRGLIPAGSGGLTVKIHVAPEQWTSTQKFQFFDGMSVNTSAAVGPLTLGRSYSPVAGTSSFAHTNDFGLGSPRLGAGVSTGLSTCLVNCPR